MLLLQWYGSYCNGGSFFINFYGSFGDEHGSLEVLLLM